MALSIGLTLNIKMVALQSPQMGHQSFAGEAFRAMVCVELPEGTDRRDAASIACIGQISRRFAI